MFTLFQHCHHSFKGFAAVAGIASILVLQLAFTIFLKTSDLFAQSDVLVRTSDVALYPVGMPIKNSVAAFPMEVPAPAAAIGDQEVSITRPRVQTEIATYRRNQVARNYRTAKSARNTVRTSPEAVFSNTIIKVGYSPSTLRSSIIMEEPVVAERTITTPTSPVTKAKGKAKTKTDKRSFVASVLPIVKKPYGWMKALGSKLF